MIVIFTGSDYNRNFAEFYLMNFFGFARLDPKEDVLEATKSLFRLTDMQVFGEDFNVDKIGLFNSMTPRELYNIVEETILKEFPDYYERTVEAKIIEKLDEESIIKIVIANTTEVNPYGHLKNVEVVNLENSTWSEEEFCNMLDDWLAERGITKIK